MATAFNGHHFLMLFGPSCWKGPVGLSGTACPLANFTDLTDPGAERKGHATVIVNPCTHHALAATQEELNGKRLTVVKAVDQKGTVVAKWTASACDGPSCTVNSPGSWPRYFPRPQLDVRVAGKSCTLFVGWDKIVDVSGSLVELNAVLGSIDVTHESNGTIPVIWSADTSGGESLLPVPVASRFGPAIGVFYVQRHAGAKAHQTFRAAVTTDPSFQSGVTDLVVQDQIPSTLWMGDNLSQLMGGIPGGQLLAIWPGPPPVAGGKCSATVVGSLINVAPPPPPPKPANPCPQPGLPYLCTCAHEPSFCTKSGEVCQHACGGNVP